MSALRPALLRDLTDLYVEKASHTPEEERLFTELALRLIDHVDAAERARLGARLATYPGAPMAVMLRLADAEPPPSVAASPHTEFPPQNLPRIEQLHREETLSDAFFNAPPSERRLILLHLDYAPIAPAPVRTASDVGARLEQAAMTRQRDEFAAALEQMLSISFECARRIASDASGEAVIAALKALAVPSPAVQRILLFLDPAVGQAADTYFSLVRLYEEIDEDSARRLIAIWQRDDASPQKSQHQTHLFDDRASRARDFARHEARQTVKPLSGHTPSLHRGQGES